MINSNKIFTLLVAVVAVTSGVHAEKEAAQQYSGGGTSGGMGGMGGLSKMMPGTGGTGMGGMPDFSKMMSGMGGTGGMSSFSKMMPGMGGTGTGGASGGLSSFSKMMPGMGGASGGMGGMPDFSKMMSGMGGGLPSMGGGFSGLSKMMPDFVLTERFLSRSAGGGQTEASESVAALPPPGWGRPDAVGPDSVKHHGSDVLPLPVRAEYCFDE
ncbi:hypothetical protein PF010_g24148 [Phytophthora fragariae]|uniref:RxLR effector protein n=1 Tax=Phytophthora fragariae TaxID=53985 RepID=A0A6G0K4D6_9STRA|nr:hypothetical protein PF010_g24148 [Phytophthora fragariae]